MAWYQEYKTNAAGQLKSFLDYIITNYGQENGYGWSIVDNDAGQNIGVYKCQPDANSSFILVAKDNQADYATIEYWDGWDSQNHVGVGNSMTYGRSSSYLLRIRKATGQFCAAINRQRIVFISLAGGWANYLGYPKRFDESKDTPLFIGHNSYSSEQNYGMNPLSTNYYMDTYCAIEWRWFRDSIGNINRTAANLGANATSFNFLPRFDTKTPAGTYLIFETPVQEHQSPYFCLGLLDGVMCKSNCPSGLGNGDKVYVSNDVWLAVYSPTLYSTCLVRMA